MEWFVLVVFLGVGWLAYKIYRAGKRDGSRGGFGAGRRRERQVGKRRFG